MPVQTIYETTSGNEPLVISYHPGLPKERQIVFSYGPERVGILFAAFEQVVALAKTERDDDTLIARIGMRKHSFEVSDDAVRVIGYARARRGGSVTLPKRELIAALRTIAEERHRDAA